MAQYQCSVEAPWIIEFLRDRDSDIKFLAKIKIVQTLYGAETVHQITPLILYQ